MQLTSSAFTEGATIPIKYTCKGVDFSPPLAWKNVPQGTVSFALIMDDPDAPMGTWDHWVVYNIPSHTTDLVENASILEPAVQGMNSWGNRIYNGPCPPPGNAHRYYFALYALDTTLSFSLKPNKVQVLHKMKDHVLDKAVLMGYFQRAA